MVGVYYRRCLEQNVNNLSRTFNILSVPPRRGRRGLVRRARPERRVPRTAARTTVAPTAAPNHAASWDRTGDLCSPNRLQLQDGQGRACREVQPAPTKGQGQAQAPGEGQHRAAAALSVPRKDALDVELFVFLAVAEAGRLPYRASAKGDGEVGRCEDRGRTKFAFTLCPSTISPKFIGSYILDYARAFLTFPFSASARRRSSARIAGSPRIL